MTVSELISALNDLIFENAAIGERVAEMEVCWGGGDPENEPHPIVIDGRVLL